MSSNQPIIVTPPNSPLDQSHLDQINRGLAAIDSAQKQINLATAAGIDVTQQANQLNNARQQLMQLKQVYFPNH